MRSGGTNDDRRTFSGWPPCASSRPRRAAALLSEDRDLGRFCILCERVRPNEAFGGKSRRARICRQCRRLPRDALLHEREILGWYEWAEYARHCTWDDRPRGSPPMGPAHLVGHRPPVEEKIRLFRSLFRGREDLYARRFESRKTGRSGYAPACANE